MHVVYSNGAVLKAFFDNLKTSMSSNQNASLHSLLPILVSIIVFKNNILLFSKKCQLDIISFYHNLPDIIQRDKNSYGIYLQNIWLNGKLFCLSCLLK